MADRDQYLRVRVVFHVAGHYGGDYYMMKDAVRYFNGVCDSVSVTKIDDSLNGHYICYAAEESRAESRVVDLRAGR